MNSKKVVKVEWIYKIPKKEERKKGLFYYDIRDADIGNGYTIERHVFVNNIGSLITNVDILKGKQYITDEEFNKLNIVNTKF